MELELIRGIWDYHWWGNRKLFDETAALGEETAKKEVGKQFSFPTLKGMLAHIYGADRIWLTRWKGESPTRLSGDADVSSLAVNGFEGNVGWKGQAQLQPTPL